MALKAGQKPKTLHTPKPGEGEGELIDYEVSVIWRGHRVTMHGHMSWVKDHEAQPHIFVKQMKLALGEALVAHLVKGEMGEIEARRLVFGR